MTMFGKSDASTSTEEIKARGLCMYYFAAPLGVWSAEPPAALSPAGWVPATSHPRYDLGAAALHRRPVPIRPSSPLLSSEWLSSGSSARRVPYHTILPPLRLPTPRYSADESDDFWPEPALPARAWLPPLQLPPPAPADAPGSSRSRRSSRSTQPPPASRRRRFKGVRKRRRRLADMQHALTTLTRRRVRGTGRASLSCSGALRAALTELRAAWTPPRTSSFMSTWSRCERETVFERDSARSSIDSSMSRRAVWADMPSRPGASPGLLRRRYSAPETVMRKYRLEQQCEMWCSSAGSGRSPATSPGRARAAAAPLRRAAVLRRAAGCNLHASPARPSRIAPPTYELLEVVVTESLSPQSLPPATRTTRAAPHSPLDIDEYVSSVLVESLNSLTDRIESAIGDARVSLVEKEIKVRLQNAGVNTIVHLSPTSNNQIIFGNEELCNREERDECNNLRSPLTIPELDAGPSPVPSPPASPGCDDNGNPPAGRAVLRQLQRLFRDDPPPPMPPPVPYPATPPAPPDSAAALRICSLTTSTSAAESPPGAVSTDPRSVEALPSRGASPAASLADSLDDPASPRRDVLALLPPPAPAAPPTPPPPAVTPPAHAFFVQIRDDARAAAATVADLMPPRLRHRLQRRQRRRQLRAESRRRRPARDAAALLEAALDDLIANIVRDEFQALRKALPSARQPPLRAVNDKPNKQPARDPLECRLAAEKRASLLRGRLSLQPHPPPSGSRRLYQKSEILEGSKRVEILEILEYVDTSSSSADASPSDEQSTRGRRSRIPVPVNSANSQRSSDTSRLRRLLRDALGGSPAPAPRPRSGSLRCRPVFAAIPEERPVPAARSAGTSPPPRAAANKATMTSPARRHAATSPAPAPEQRRPSPPKSCAPPSSRAAPPPLRTVPSLRPADSAKACADSSSSGCENGDSPLAPRRRRRRPARDAPGRSKAKEVIEAKSGTSIKPAKTEEVKSSTAWSVTVGGERAPQELQLRLRFPTPGPDNRNAQNPATHHHSCTPDTSTTRTDVVCSCHHCRMPSRALPPAPVPHHPRNCTSRNGSDHAARLPALRRDSLAGQVKTRRVRSPRSWRPSDAPVLTVSASALQVVGNAVRPTRRPRRR